MKIWIMNHYASSMYRDKAGRHYWFAKKLEEKGHKVSVFCASEFHDRQNGVDIKGSQWIIKKDNETPFIFVKVHKSRGNGIGRVRNMVEFYINLFPAMKGYAKSKGKPDVIIASSVHPLTMIAGIKMSRRFSVPCVCEVRDLWPEAIFYFGKARENSLIGRILLAGEHWIYKNANALIFTKEGDTDYLKERKWAVEEGGDIDLNKCHYINNGVNFDDYAKHVVTDTLDDFDLLDSSKFNVTYVGMIRPVNNVGNILDSAAILKDKADNIQFLIYGDGSEYEKLKQRVENEGLTNVKIKGFVARKHVPYILSKSSVNILNYTQNQYNWTRGNSSNKMFEYMASGKPVISTVKMGYSIIERYHCGIELEKCTPDALTQAILDIYEMPRDTYETMGKNAIKGVLNFDFTLLTDILEKVLKSVLV